MPRYLPTLIVFALLLPGWETGYRLSGVSPLLLPPPPSGVLHTPAPGV